MDKDKLKGAVASELIIVAMETKGKRPTQLNFEEMIDVVADVVNKISAYHMLADSLPLSELKQTLYEVNTLIAGWNATEAEWSEWDKEVQNKVNKLQAKLDGKEAANFR